MSRAHDHEQPLPERLLAAAEIELAKNGIEGISLRAVAKRAGVSHGAPAHHFGDGQGLLTALATKGYEKLLRYQQKESEAANKDALSQIVADGIGYIEFASDSPELFRLMFSSAAPNREDKHFAEVSLRVFERLVQNIQAYKGGHPFADHERMKDLMASWSVVHGLADLVISGRAERTLALNELSDYERRKTLQDILTRVNPSTLS